jgi:hypothetical protein
VLFTNTLSPIHNTLACLCLTSVSGRELFKKEEQLSSQGPGITYNHNGSEQRSVGRAHVFSGANKTHERNLFKSEERRAAEVPGAGKYNVSSGNVSQSSGPGIVWTHLQLVGRPDTPCHVTQVRGAKTRLRHVCTCTAGTTSRGIARRSSSATIGTARMCHSRDLWEKQEKRASEVHRVLGAILLDWG